MKKKIVIFGGGTGLSGLLNSLKDFPVELTAVITVSDSGRSTGKLREEFFTPAVGDVRKVLTTLSELPEEIKDIMEYRFDTYSDLDGHPLGNLVLTALFNKTKSLKTSIEYLSKMLDVKQKVLPLSEDYLTLMGETIDGEIIEGEARVTDARKQYKRIFYKEQPHVLKEVIEAIKDTDLIILSIGSLYTSILPHLLCEEVVNAIRSSNAKLMYICNAVTQPGETDNFGVSDHVRLIETYLGKDTVDVVIASDTKIKSNIKKNYEQQEQKKPVIIDYDNLKNMKLELIVENLVTYVDGTIRHNSLKLSTIIFSYLMR